MTYEGVLLIGQEALVDTMVDLMIDFAGALIGVVFVLIALKIDKNFLKTFRIKKVKMRDVEVEDIEE